jgi:hypothetical protein
MSDTVRSSPSGEGEHVRDSLRGLLMESGRWHAQRDREAFTSFDTLVKKGCDPVFLVSRLIFLAEASRSDTWVGLTGFADLDTLRTALKRVRLCADDIDKMLGAVIAKASKQNPSQPGLPTNLRNLADHIEETARSITPRRNLTSRAARAEIVCHVEDQTGRPRDRLIASILYPVLHCDERDQLQWRRDNSDIIFALRRT